MFYLGEFHKQVCYFLYVNGVRMFEWQSVGVGEPLGNKTIWKLVQWANLGIQEEQWCNAIYFKKGFTLAWCNTKQFGIPLQDQSSSNSWITQSPPPFLQVAALSIMSVIMKLMHWEILSLFIYANQTSSQKRFFIFLVIFNYQVLAWQ